jgi:hypothetical protein
MTQGEDPESVMLKPEAIAAKLRPRHRFWLDRALSPDMKLRRLQPINAMGCTDCDDLEAWGLLRRVGSGEWMVSWDIDLARAVLAEMKAKEQP